MAEHSTNNSSIGSLSTVDGLSNNSSVGSPSIATGSVSSANGGGTSGGGDITLTRRIMEAIESNHFILPDAFFSLQKVEEPKATIVTLYTNAFIIYIIGLSIFIALFVNQSNQTYTETKVTTTDISFTDSSWSCTMASTVTSNYFNYHNATDISTTPTTSYVTPIPVLPYPNSIAENYFLVNLNELETQCLQDLNTANPCNTDSGAVQYYQNPTSYSFSTTIQSFLSGLSGGQGMISLISVVNGAIGLTPSLISYDPFTGGYADNTIYNSYVLNAITTASSTLSSNSLLPQLATTKQRVSLFLSPASTVPGNPAVGCVYYTASQNNDVVGCYPGVTKMHNDLHYNVYLSNVTTVMKLNVSTTIGSTGQVTQTVTSLTVVADFTSLFVTNGNDEEIVDFTAILIGSTTTVYAATNKGIVRSIHTSGSGSGSGSSNTASIYSFSGITGVLGFNTSNPNILLFYNGSLSTTTVSGQNWLFSLDVSSASSVGTLVSQQHLPDTQCPYFLVPPPPPSSSSASTSSSSMISNAIFLCSSTPTTPLQWFFYYPDNPTSNTNNGNSIDADVVNLYAGDALLGNPALNAGWLVCVDDNIDSFYPKITQPQQMTFYCRRNGIAWEIAPENSQMYLTSTYATYYLNQLTSTYCNASTLYTEICDIVGDLPPYICTRSKALPFFTALSTALSNANFSMAIMFIAVGFILSVIKKRKEENDRKQQLVRDSAMSMATIVPPKPVVTPAIHDKTHKMADLEDNEL